MPYYAIKLKKVIRNGSCSMWFWVSATSLNQKWISSSSINQNLPRPSHVWSWTTCSWTCADSMSRTTTLLSQHVSHPPFFVLWSDPKDCKNPHVRAGQAAMPCTADHTFYWNVAIPSLQNSSIEKHICLHTGNQKNNATHILSFTQLKGGPPMKPLEAPPYKLPFEAPLRYPSEGSLKPPLKPLPPSAPLETRLKFPLKVPFEVPLRYASEG